jgi:hypothetical protein
MGVSPSKAKLARLEATQLCDQTYVDSEYSKLIKSSGSSRAAENADLDFPTDSWLKSYLGVDSSAHESDYRQDENVASVVNSLLAELAVSFLRYCMYRGRSQYFEP